MYFAITCSITVYPRGFSFISFAFSPSVSIRNRMPSAFIAFTTYSTIPSISSNSFSPPSIFPAPSPPSVFSPPSPLSADWTACCITSSARCTRFTCMKVFTSMPSTRSFSPAGISWISRTIAAYSFTELSFCPRRGRVCGVGSRLTFIPLTCPASSE